MIPLLKKLGFIDQANVPTQAYKDYRDEAQSGSVMARQLRQAYNSLFTANEYAWKLEKKELQSKLKNVTGAGDDDPNIPNVAGTFLELSRLASWNGAAPSRPQIETAPTIPGTNGHRQETSSRTAFAGARLGLSYTINLNLPATTEIEVFNAIFKSLRENLLREQ